MSASDEEILASLYKIRENIIAAIQNLTLNPKPNYEIDGQKVDWGDYLDLLYKQMKANDALIISLDEPYEKTSTIYT